MSDPYLQQVLGEAANSWELKLLFTILVLLSAGLLRWFGLRVVVRRIENPTVRVLWRQILSWSILTVSLFVLAWIWFKGIGAVLTILSLVAAALTIVHKELILNFSSWSVIAWRGLFSLGDVVEVGITKGKVTNLGPLYFTLSEMDLSGSGFQPTGRTIRVPNMQVLTQPVINHSGEEVVWPAIAFKVPFESDWRLARGLFEEVVRDEVRSVDPKRSDSLRSPVSIGIEGQNVQLTARYPCLEEDRVHSASRVSEAVLDKLGKNGISLA